jgi:hypothetical protein
LSAPAFRNLSRLESKGIDVCLGVGVHHVVLHSALGAADYSKSFPGWHRKVEDKLKASKLSYTIVRPNSFMQNLVAYSAPIIRAKCLLRGHGQRKTMLDMGMPEWQVTALLDLQQYYSILGKGGEVTHVLPDLLGLSPITVDQLLAEFKDSFPQPGRSSVTVCAINGRKKRRRWSSCLA